jgi:hypothetical protein
VPLQVVAKHGRDRFLLCGDMLSRDTVTRELIHDTIFDEGVCDLLSSAILFSIRMFDEGGKPRPVIGKVFALASECSI